MSSPRRIVLLVTFVIVLVATALLADEAPVVATGTAGEFVTAQLSEPGTGQFSLAVRQQPIAMNFNDGEQSEPVQRQTDGAALARYLERPDPEGGKLFGVLKPQSSGNPSLGVAGLQAGYGEIFSREYVSPHNRNGTEIEEPTTAYVKSNFSF